MPCNRKKGGKGKRPKLFLLSAFSLFSLLSLFFLSSVSAGGVNHTVNITDWDDSLGENLGLSGEDASIAGGAVLTGVLFMMFFLPSIIFTKGKNALEILVVSGVIPCVIGTAFGWLDGFVLILVIMVSSMVLAMKVGGIFGK